MTGCDGLARRRSDVSSLFRAAKKLEDETGGPLMSVNPGRGRWPKIVHKSAPPAVQNTLGGG